MIHNRELRRGNYVDVGNGVRDKVIEIYTDSISTLTKQNIFEFYPIELTPEIFEKTDFVYHDDDGIISYNKDGIFIWEKYGPWGAYYELNGFSKCTFEFVHEFQNIVFDLTKKELNIQL